MNRTIGDVKRLNRWLSIIAIGLVVLTFDCIAWAAKPKADGAKADGKAIEKMDSQADSTDAKSAPTLKISGPALPPNLNLASLRLKALDSLYELDLSIDQLNQLKTAAAGAASSQSRSPAKGIPKLISTMRDFQSALLDGKDTDQIDNLRNQLSDLTDDEKVHLDDEVTATATARAKAPDVLREFTASQIAAFLASHADEVGDPVEMMFSAVEELRDQHADANDPDAEKISAEDEAKLIQSTADDVADSVAGMNEEKSKALAADVAKWIKTTVAMKDDDFTSGRKELETTAKGMIGNVHPMRVLDNWLQRQVAQLLSNPQLPEAIDALIQAREQAK